jgi:23S rRNA pseudouridine1911/1915/1917 synthase
MSLPAAAPGLVILYEDNHLLVLDKPAGLLSQGAAPGDDNAVTRVADFLRVRHAKPGQVYVGLVHRLDRNTSGVLVLARTSKAASRLAAAFSSAGIPERPPGRATAPRPHEEASARAEKTYLAVVHGLPPSEALLTHALLEHDHGVRVVPPATPGARQAALRLRVVASTARHALVEVSLLTGRKHQIRAQLAAAGHPLVGDVRYGPPRPPPGTPAFARPALHAASVALLHPVRREPVRFEAPLPADLRALLAALGFPSA